MERLCLMEREAEIQQRWEHVCALNERFAAIFAETDAECAARLAREVAIDGELAAVPAAHRLAVVRQLIVVLEEHGLINYERNDVDEHWRVAAKRLGLPYLEVYHAVWADRHRSDVVRSDLDEWLEWARVHAPERLAAGKEVA